ncbi:MAG: DUF4153 domain-containing protein [Bacteroidetes bacterium]|nr:MAG: DUF4153 domain-containing protein [Bacteroidota bacterium]
MAFKLASLETILDRFWNTFKRFPLAIIVAIAGTVTLMLTLDIDEWELQQDLIRVTLACIVVMPALIAVGTFGEARRVSDLWAWAMKVLVLALGVVFWLTVDHLEGYKYPVVFLLLVLATHLMVAFAPWIGGKKEGFWQYNKQLFLQILVAVIYSGVLFAGLAIAILAVDQLFNADIEEETYMRLFFFIGGVFNTIFFLSGVPRDYQVLETDESYPKGLKIFTQYVLLPLVFIYLVILYAYMAKILIQAEWPVGWVSILVLCFSIAGIFSFLLIYPLRNKQEERWISVFNRWFYIALIPLTVMLFVAIFKRLQQYGFTEERYFVLLLAFWLTGIIAYFLLSKKDDIRVIPVSLFVLSLAAVFTAFPIARMSQLNRFEDMLEKYDLLEDGKIKLGDKEPDFAMEKDLSSIFDFLDDREDMTYIQPYVSFDLDSLEAEVNKGKKRGGRIGSRVMSELGMTYRSKYSHAPTSGNEFETYTYYGPANESFEIAGFEQMRRQYFNENINYEDKEPYILYEEGIGYVVTYKEKKLPVDLVAFAQKMARENPKGTYDPLDEILLEAENEELALRLYFIDFRFEMDKDKKIEDISGSVWMLVREQ